MKKRYALIIVLFIFGFIFYLSSIPGLKVVPVLKQANGYLLNYDISVVNLAKSIAKKLPQSTQLTPVKTAGHDFYYYAKTNPVIIEYLLRKAAHITVFFFLTLGVFLFINQFSRKIGLSVMISYILSCGLAFLDEYHQSFVTDRTGSLIDVGIDSIVLELIYSDQNLTIYLVQKLLIFMSDQSKICKYLYTEKKVEVHYSFSVFSYLSLNIYIIRNTVQCTCNCYTIYWSKG